MGLFVNGVSQISLYLWPTFQEKLGTVPSSYLLVFIPVASYDNPSDCAYRRECIQMHTHALWCAMCLYSLSISSGRFYWDAVQQYIHTTLPHPTSILIIVCMCCIQHSLKAISSCILCTVFVKLLGTIEVIINKAIRTQEQIIIYLLLKI